MSRGHKLKKFISAVAAALLPIAALSSITAAPAQAVVTPGPALTCTSGGFYTDATKNIFQFNSSTDSFDWAFSSRHALTTALDGLAFDSRDNYLYGWNAGHLYQVDNTGAEVDLGVQGGLSATLESADYWPSADVIISATNGSWRSTKVASDSTSATTSAAITASGGNLAEDHVLVPTSSTVAEVYGLDSGKVYDTTVTLTAGVLTSASTRSVSVTLPSAVTSSGNTAASAQAPAAYSDAAGNVYFIMTKASQAKHDIISYTSAQLAAMFASPPVTATPTYYLNIASSNAAYGTSPSDGAGCKTAPSMFSPALVTTTAATVSGTSATLGGTVTPGNFSGATIPVGNAVICYSSSNAVDANGILSSSPTCSSGNTVAVAQNAANTAIPDYNLSGLAAGTYYYQAKATNSSALTNHGAVLSFTIAGTPSGFNVTWDPNGGSVSPTSSSNVTTVTAPTPTLAGNAFNGWTCVPDGTPVSPVSAGTTFTPSANTTCTASWTAYTVTYSYGTGGGTVPTSPNSGVVVLPVQGAMTAPTGGYTFGGWTCTPGTPTTTLAAGASFTPSGNATCTAVWNAPSPTTYNVTWNYNNGSGNTTSSGVTTVTTPNPSNPGYSFNGWSCSPAGTPANLVAAGVTFTPSANTTCTASWTYIPPVYTVTFVSNGNTVSSTSGVAGTVITCPAAPTRAGWIFKGWSACAAGGSYTITGSATISAIWVEELAAQPNANGGENNHQAAPAILVVNPAINGDVYSDPTSGMRLTLTPHEADQTPAPLNSENQVVFKDGRLAKVAGSGLQPNSDVKVYISKDAITGLQSLTVGTAAIRNKSAIIGDVVLLGTLHTDANGSFSDFLPIPQGLAIGAHVLQVDGYAKDWSLQSANFPVLYALPKVVTKSLTVYFTPDSAEFTAATKAAIAALVAQLPKEGEQFSISSKGFVYPIDSHTANMQISSARAKAVAGAIKAAIKDLGQEATVDHVGLGRLKAAKSTSRRVQATVSWTVYTTTA